MAKPDPTTHQLAISALQEKREKMRAIGIGEPCVEVDLRSIQTFNGEDGTLRAIIGMDKLIVLVDSALRA